MKKAMSVLVCFILVFSLAGNALAYEFPVSKIGFKYVNAEKGIDEDIVLKVDAEREAAFCLESMEKMMNMEILYALGDSGVSMDHKFTAEEAAELEAIFGNGIVANDTIKDVVLKNIKAWLKDVFVPDIYTEAQINALTDFEKVITAFWASIYFLDEICWEGDEALLKADYTPGDSMLSLTKAIHKSNGIAATGFNAKQSVYFIDRTGGDHEITLSELAPPTDGQRADELPRMFAGIYYGRYMNFKDIEGWVTTVYDKWVNDIEVGSKIPLKLGMNYIDVGPGVVMDENGTVDGGDTYTFIVNVIAPSISEFEINGTKFTIDPDAKTIKGELPSGTNLNGLKPTVVFNGKTLTPASGAAADFTNPVKYTVMADDGSTVEYTITATLAKAEQPPEENPIPPTGAEIPATIVLIFIVSAAAVMLMKRRAHKA